MVRTELTAGELAAPEGVPEELCTRTGLAAPCATRLTEFVRPDPRPDAAEPALRIVQPATGTHLWRNPEVPAAMNRLALRASAAPGVTQVVWLVDGQPAATAPPDAPFYWTMTAGRHRFQLRLPSREIISPSVSVLVDE